MTNLHQACKIHNLYQFCFVSGCVFGLHVITLYKVCVYIKADLLETDERVGRRYLQQIEELREQLEREKETACNRERDLAQNKYENVFFLYLRNRRVSELSIFSLIPYPTIPYHTTPRHTTPHHTTHHTPHQTNTSINHFVF